MERGAYHSKKSRTLFEKITGKSQKSQKNHPKIIKITEKSQKSQKNGRKITKKSHKNHQNHKKITVIFEITKISNTFFVSDMPLDLEYWKFLWTFKNSHTGLDYLSDADHIFGSNLKVRTKTL